MRCGAYSDQCSAIHLVVVAPRVCMSPTSRFHGRSPTDLNATALPALIAVGQTVHTSKPPWRYEQVHHSSCTCPSEKGAFCPAALVRKPGCCNLSGQNIAGVCSPAAVQQRLVQCPGVRSGGCYCNVHMCKADTCLVLLAADFRGLTTAARTAVKRLCVNHAVAAAAAVGLKLGEVCCCVHTWNSSRPHLVQPSHRLLCRIPLCSLEHCAATLHSVLVC